MQPTKFNPDELISVIIKFAAVMALFLLASFLQWKESLTL